jgi:hypothetical protein
MEMNVEHWWNDNDRTKTVVLGEKHHPVPIFPPQLLHGLNWDQTQVSVVNGRRITARAMARQATAEVGMNNTQNFGSYLTENT